MTKKLLGIFAVLLSGIWFSCTDNMGLDPEESLPVDRGSLLVVDEANQVLNQVNLNNYSVKQVSYVGQAANSIQIDGDYAYVVNSLSDTLIRLNLATGGSIQVLVFASGANPYQMAVDSNYILVTLNISNQLSVIDKTNFQIVTNIDLQPAGYPQGLTSDNQYIYITSSDGYFGDYANSRLTVLAKSNFAFITNLSTPTNPQAVTLSASGTVYVACTGKGFPYAGGGLFSVSPVSLSTDTVEPDVQLDGVYGTGELILVSDSSWGSSLLGFAIYSNDVRLTNLLAGQGFKTILADNDCFYLSEPYGGDYVYQISRQNYSLNRVISNTGGGAAALYQ